MARKYKGNPKWEQIKPAYAKAVKDGSVEKLLKGLKSWWNRATAYTKAKISHDNFYNWYKGIPNFATNVELAEFERMAYIQNAKAKKIKAGYWPAIEKELKAKMPEQYGDKSSVDVTSGGKELAPSNIVVEIVTGPIDGSNST